jgi:hypothetical protein
LFVVCVVAGCGHKEPEYPPGTTHPTSAEQPAPAVTAQPQPKAPLTEPKAPAPPPHTTGATVPAPMATAPSTIPPSTATPAPLPAETPKVTPGPREMATTDDRTITKNVHAAIMADKTLAPLAKNVHITTLKGRVTLHGTVMIEQEKLAIENKVKAQPGVVSVDDLLIVKKKK